MKHLHGISRFGDNMKQLRDPVFPLVYYGTELSARDGNPLAGQQGCESA